MQYSIVIIFIIAHFHLVGYSPDYKGSGIALSCEVVNGEDLRIWIKNSCDTLTVLPNPCPASMGLWVYKNNREISRKILIRVNPECIHPKLELNPLESKAVVNPYGGFSLKELFDLQSEEEYEVYIKYFPSKNTSDFIDCRCTFVYGAN